MVKDGLVLFLDINVELLNYLLAYVILFGSGITRKPGRWVAGLGIIYGIEYMIFFNKGIDEACSCIMLCVIVVPLLLLREQKRKWFALYPVILMGTSIINICGTFVVGIILGIPETEVTDNVLWYLLCTNISNTALILVFLYKKIRKSKPEEMEISWHQYIIFYTGLACSFVIVGGSQLITEIKTMSMRLQNAYGLSMSLICMLFVIMSLWQGIIVAKEEKYRQQTKLYEEYMKVQEQQIREVIWNDEKMRRYRHDMKAHLTAIHSCLEHGGSEEAKEYYDAMVEQSAVFDMKSYTGNQAVDAVIRQLCGVAEEKNISINYTGTMPDSFQVSVFDLCTIVSNLLRNAINACEKEDGKKEIQFGLYDCEDNLCIVVKNTSEKRVEVRNGRLVVPESDSRYHGLGIGNVKNVVEKNDGSMEYIWEDGWIQVRILL